MRKIRQVKHAHDENRFSLRKWKSEKKQQKLGALAACNAMTCDSRFTHNMCEELCDICPRRCVVDRVLIPVNASTCLSHRFHPPPCWGVNILRAHTGHTNANTNQNTPFTRHTHTHVLTTTPHNTHHHNAKDTIKQTQPDTDSCFRSENENYWRIMMQTSHR